MIRLESGTEALGRRWFYPSVSCSSFCWRRFHVQLHTNKAASGVARLTFFGALLLWFAMTRMQYCFGFALRNVEWLRAGRTSALCIDRFAL